MNPSKNKPSRKKESSIQPRVSRAAEQPDLAAHVAELQGQLAALRAAVEGRETSVESQERVERPRSRASANPKSTSASSPVESSGYSTGPSHSPLHHAVAAQHEGGPLPATSYQLPATNSPVSGFQSQVSSLKSQVSSSIPIYELKETRPVGYQFTDFFDSSAEETQDGFFSGLLDRVRIQWLMGDYESLSKLDLEQINTHPDRAKLALFGAVGLMQTGRPFDALKYLEFAKSQGCSSKLIKTILLSGIHTSMYSANLLNGHENKAGRHKSELDRFGLPNSMPKSFHLWNREQSSAFPALRQSLLEISPRIKGLAEQVANDPNPSEKSMQLLKTEKFGAREKFLFLCQLSKEFQKRGNKLVAASYLEEASHVLPLNQSADHLWFIVKRLLELGMLEDAFAKRLMIPENHHVLNSEEKMSLQKAGMNLLEKIYNFKGHGHELLISILQKYAARLRSECAGRKPVLIEIGTTRESASGQDSTRRLAELCRREKFHFITVDMDSACTEMAREMFIENGFSFEAIHSKGEDFLASYSGPIDGIFLDAYDFDHGMHTELRQSRYEKFLGSRISEIDCHQMHLDCTLEIIKKANPWTLVCLDDTWLNLGRWTAKGTLAVPCLFENGYQLLDVRNKAVLMGAGYWSAQVPAGKPY